DARVFVGDRHGRKLHLQPVRPRRRNRLGDYRRRTLSAANVSPHSTAPLATRSPTPPRHPKPESPTPLASTPLQSVRRLSSSAALNRSSSSELGGSVEITEAHPEASSRSIVVAPTMPKWRGSPRSLTARSGALSRRVTRIPLTRLRSRR